MPIPVKKVFSKRGFQKAKNNELQDRDLKIAVLQIEQERACHFLTRLAE